MRENVSLLIGLAGSSGSGKTYTAMRLARGIAGDKPFAVIDTEAGRAKHYADAFRFDHGDLQPPFRPGAYAEAIAAADRAGYPVIVVDSMSHEWAGTGGVLDWQEEEFKRLGERDAVKLLSWAKPKQGHKHMVQELLQLRAHLILCFRAEEKIDMIKVEENGKTKTKIVPKEGPGGFKGWLPICEKNLPYELTASFLLLAEAPGVPQPIKLQEQHRPLFPLGKPITEESGRAIAAWAAGGQPKSAPEEAKPATESLPSSPPPAAGASAAVITADQCAILETLCQDAGVKVEKLRAAVGVERLAQIKESDYQRALDWVKRVDEARRSRSGEART
ncbi:MAG TPA: AAA family ATPase [Usitatibacter sp.]|nr:AAA family ATPase [Usitatibacter sp.]